MNYFPFLLALACFFPLTTAYSSYVPRTPTKIHPQRMVSASPQQEELPGVYKFELSLLKKIEIIKRLGILSYLDDKLQQNPPYIDPKNAFYSIKFPVQDFTIFGSRFLEHSLHNPNHDRITTSTAIKAIIYLKRIMSKKIRWNKYSARRLFTAALVLAYDESQAQTTLNERRIFPLLYKDFAEMSEIDQRDLEKLIYEFNSLLLSNGETEKFITKQQYEQEKETLITWIESHPVFGEALRREFRLEQKRKMEEDKRGYLQLPKIQPSLDGPNIGRPAARQNEGERRQPAQRRFHLPALHPTQSPAVVPHPARIPAVAPHPAPPQQQPPDQHTRRRPNPHARHVFINPFH